MAPEGDGDRQFFRDGNSDFPSLKANSGQIRIKTLLQPAVF